MSAGFPDDHRPFVPFGSRLAKENDTLVGIICLPGYDDREEKPFRDHMKNRQKGYTLDEMSVCFREAAKALRSESTAKSKVKFTGIFHDWAVAIGLLWANRAIADGSDNAPDELVLFDVLSPPHPSTHDIPPADKTPFLQTIPSWLYRVIFVVSFEIQRIISNAIASFFFIFALTLLTVLKLGPTLKIDDETREKLGMPNLTHMIYMCYPYCNLWKKTEDLKEACLPQNLSKCPVLYLYGTKKRGTFHDSSGLKLLQREHEKKMSKSNAIAVDEAGHYLYLQKPDICFDYVVKFMQE